MAWQMLSQTPLAAAVQNAVPHSRDTSKSVRQQQRWQQQCFAVCSVHLACYLEIIVNRHVQLVILAVNAPASWQRWHRPKTPILANATSATQ
jgi:hypothetical protein